MISQELQQRLELRLSPQQLQFLKLLQQPLLTLEQSIKQELELNPVLEEIEEEISELSDEQPVEAEEQKEEENIEEPEEDDFNLEDLLDDDTTGYKSSDAWSGDTERDEMPLEEHITLAEALREQLHLLSLSEEELHLADEIIGNLDEDGYLRQTLEDILASANISLSLEHAEKILKHIQRLEPPGLAARTLKECLLAQLDIRHFDPTRKELARKILELCYDDYVNKRYERILDRLDISIDEYKEADALIHKLNPKPGEGSTNSEELTIIPDFIVRQENDELVVESLSTSVPTLRINKRYIELLSQKENHLSKEEKDFIKQRLEAARTFLQCIQQRQTTLLDVMKAIVMKQKDFFETGENLKPLTNREIAEMVGLDESTTSRASHGKYVQTQHGIYSLKHFFSSKVQQDNGEEISNKEARLKIKRLIENEDKSHPLSDDELAKILKELGLSLARRTVAKYREAIGIPIARLRRKI